MRRYILVATLLLLASPSAFGWGRVGHAAIAQVAENHISKSTKKALKRYMPEATIVEVASDADKYYYQWSRDLGFECSNPKILRRRSKAMDHLPSNIEPWCHSYTVDSLFNTYRHNREGDLYIRNAVMDIELLINELKNGRGKMEREECRRKISLVVHLVGDIHCPMHVLYIPQDPTGGKYPFYIDGKRINAHSYWDSSLIRRLEPDWTYYEYAQAVDTASAKEIAEIQRGDIYDWGKSSAVNSFPAHSLYPNGGELSSEYPEKHRDLLYMQLRNAGYRLAKVLNYIFEKR